MKKTLLLLIVVLSLFSITPLFAQEAPRYKMEMTVEANGKTAKVDLSSVNYSINRNEYDTASETKKDKGKSKDAYIQPNTFYVSITLNKIDKDLLSIVADKKAGVTGVITITDTYGKEDIRKVTFKSAFVASLSENISGYSASYGSAGSLYLNVKELVVDGILLTP